MPIGLSRRSEVVDARRLLQSRKSWSARLSVVGEVDHEGKSAALKSLDAEVIASRWGRERLAGVGSVEKRQRFR